jgi:hypothetical protein
MSPVVKRSWLVFALAALAVGKAEARLVQIPVPRVAMVRALSSSDFLVTGEVTARTGIDFTILVRGSELRTVQVTEDTAIVKGGVLIKLADVMVGDKVTATLMRGGDGKLRAVNVTVSTGPGM